MTGLETSARAAPSVSLLCCTLGRTERLGRLLHSLAAQTRGDFELVLVDQNPPGTLEATLAPWAGRIAIFRFACAPGLSRARNVGLARCRAPIVAFPDDDCWYPTDLVAKLAESFAARPQTDFFAGRTLDAAGAESLGLFQGVDGPISKANVWRTGNSNCLFFRAALAREIGGFDESLGVGAESPFQSGEETDFVLRALAHGAHGEYRRDLVVGHGQTPVAGLAGLARARGYASGFGRVLRLHRFGRAYLAVRVGRSLARAALSGAVGDLAQARYKAAWALGTLKGYRAPLGARETQPQRRNQEG